MSSDCAGLKSILTQPCEALSGRCTSSATIYSVFNLILQLHGHYASGRSQALWFWTVKKSHSAARPSLLFSHSAISFVSHCSSSFAMSMLLRRAVTLAPSSRFAPILVTRSFASQPQPQSQRPGRLQGKVAVVTGGSAGIGRETAMMFAREGAKGVVVVDKNETGGQETVEMIKKTGFSNVVFQAADVSKAADCEKFVQVAEKQFGALNVLFNNAGIMHMDDDNAETTTDKVWDLTFNINVKGVFYGCKYAIPAMRRAGGGSIINTASFVALLGAATPQLAYTSSKGAVLAMSRELSVIHARENIRVNALCPGPLRTKLLMDFLDTEEKKQRRLVHVPIGRFGEAREMANAVLFLASDESSFITGTDFLVDGGITAAYVTPTGETKSNAPSS